MTFRLGQRSRARLAGVHPDLVRVVERAIAIAPVDFTVIEGVRTKERQAALYRQGRITPGPIVTWTMNSRHSPQEDGFGHAVDLAPWVDGAVEWRDWTLFEQIAGAMKKAASDLHVDIVWGGDWKKTPDGAHFELRKKDK